MKGRTHSEIEHNIRRLRKRTRTRHFSIKLHSMPGLYIENELKLVSNKARFLSSLISGDINGINRKKGELLQEIIDRGFDPIPIEWLPFEDDGESPSENFTGYEYLTGTPVSCLGEDTLHDLLKRKSELEEIMRGATPLYRGLTCLKISEKEPSVVDENFTKKLNQAVRFGRTSLPKTVTYFRQHLGDNIKKDCSPVS